MTIITVTTVGFGEVAKLSVSGKVFTIVLIVSSLGIFGYAVSVLTSSLIEGQFVHFFSGKHQIKKMRMMKNHVIVCGFGRNGQQAVRDLLYHRNKCVVIDSNHELAISHQGKGIVFIEGDATEDEVLLRAGIENAKAIIATLPNDAANLFIALSARALNPDLTIISRASNQSSEKKLRMAGVDNIVMPEKVGGTHMARLIARRDIVEFLDRLTYSGDSPTNIEEIECTCLSPELADKTIYEIGVRKKSGANIIGYKTPTGEYILNPDPTTKLMLNAKIFVLGTPDQVALMKQLLQAGDSLA